MKGIEITRSQTEIIKGIGILLIMFHNLFHWIPPITEQNEFIFNVNNIHLLLSAIVQQPLEIINIFFSYFGHYGVQLFILVSGYGLTKSYLKRHQDYSFFVKNRVSKIYPPLLMVLGALFIYKFASAQFTLDYDWLKSALFKIAMVHTLIPHEALTISGPWWFYGLIVQLYILFIPLFYVLKKWHWKGFVAVLIISYGLFFWLYAPLLEKDLYIMANAPGHLPEFTLGMLIALTPHFNLKRWAIPLLLVLFVLGNIYFALFPFTFIIVALLLTAGLLQLIQKPSKVNRLFAFYGEISMYLFAIHGSLRMPFFRLAESHDSSWLNIGIAIIYVAVATLAAFLFMKSHALVTNWITKKSSKN